MVRTEEFEAILFNLIWIKLENKVVWAKNYSLRYYYYRLIKKYSIIIEHIFSTQDGIKRCIALIYYWKSWKYRIIYHCPQSELAKNPNGSNLWQSTVFMSYEFCGTLIQWKVFISFFLQTRVFFVVNKSIVISYASHIQTYKCLPGCINRLTNERDLCAIDFIECCLSSYFDAASFHRFAMQPKSSLFSFIYFLIILMSSFW